MILYVYLENVVYLVFRQQWLVLGVKLMEINSNLFSRYYMNYMSDIDTIVIHGTACVVVLPYTETGSMCRLFATCLPHFSGHFQKMLIQF